MVFQRRTEFIAPTTLPDGMRILERGWLSCNCVVFADEAGATLIDSGYASHAEQTLALVIHAIARHATPRLRRIVNTHLHSDHCGGNALLAERTGCEIFVPEGNAAGVRDWDDGALSFEATGQRCERFDYTDTIAAGDVLMLAEEEWEALGAPGHDADSLMFFCKDEGLLIAGDALWEDGCGAMFPTSDPRSLATDIEAALETLEVVEAVEPRLVVPGHGRPFVDVPKALGKARSRLYRLAEDPERNARHVAKTLVKFRLLDERRLSPESIRAMFRDTPTLRHANRDVQLSPEAFADRTADELVLTRAARRDGEWLIDV